MLRHASSARRHKVALRLLRRTLTCLLLVVLASCGGSDAGQAPGATPASPAGPPSTAGAESGASALFAIDALVRSRQLPGVDLHLRYAERRAGQLILHLAFYNNGAEDLAYVQGID